jgi:hypothetical protein
MKTATISSVACRAGVATGCRRSVERERESFFVYGGFAPRKYCEAPAPAGVRCTRSGRARRSPQNW